MTDRQQVITIDNQSWNIAVDHYGTAGSLKEQLDGVKLDALYQKVQTLNNTASYASGYIGASLTNLKARLAQVWTGQAADQAADILNKMTEACNKISANAAQTASGLQMGADAISTAKQKMSGYSHVGADVSNVTSALGGGPSQDDQAKPVFDALVLGLSDSVHAMPHSLVMPTPVQDSRVTPGPTPGPGPGGIGPGVGPGGLPSSSLPHSSLPSSTIPHPGTLPPSSTHPGGLPPSSTGPGSMPPGGIGPGVGPGGYGPGGTGGLDTSGFGTGGYGPGVGIDTGSQLAGFEGGSGAGLSGGGGAGAFGAGGGGLGASGGGLGADGGLGAGSSTAGLSGGGAGAGGLGASGGGLAGGAGRGGVGMMPMTGGGQGGNSQDRERSTWLAEDEDVWGGDDAPPGVIA